MTFFVRCIFTHCIDYCWWNKSKMDKKIKLNNFVTFNEATNYLSKAFSESVSLAEVYRLVLSKKLTASVRLLNQTCAVDGRYIKNKSEISCINDQEYILLDQAKGIVFEQEPCLIDGIWDLSMIGMESHIIENLYRNELNELAMIDVNIKGLFVSQGDRVCKLKNVVKFDYDKAKRRSLYSNIISFWRNKCVPFIYGVFVIDKATDEAKLAFEAFKKQPNSNFVFEDSLNIEQHKHQLIIRTDELLRFVRSQQEDVIAQEPSEKPIKSKERNTLLVLIGAFCKNADIDPSARGVTPKLVAMTERVGAPLSDDSIRKILSQVPSALEMRQK